MTPDALYKALRAALPKAAEAAAAALPATEPLLAGGLDDGDEPRDELVPAGARAVTARLGGSAYGTLALVVSGALSTAVTANPLGEQPLETGLAPALEAATAALANALGRPVEISSVQEVDADIALGEDGDGRDFAAVTIRAGYEHAATLGTLLEEAPPEPEPEPEIQPELPEFAPLVPTAPASHGEGRPLALLHDVEMGVTAELGRTKMSVRDILGLAPGAVVELDRAAGSPVDVMVNGTLIARGEVVVIDEEFGIRISEIVGQPANGQRTDR